MQRHVWASVFIEVPSCPQVKMSFYFCILHLPDQVPMYRGMNRIVVGPLEHEL